MIKRFNAASGLIVVLARIWGPNDFVRAPLAIDTGATFTTVNPRLLRFLGYHPERATERVQVTTANGLTRAPKIAVSAFGALGLVRRNISVLSLALPSAAGVDGLLGLDFLRGLRLTLDFREGWLTIA